MVVFSLQRTLLYFLSWRAGNKLSGGVIRCIYLLLCLAQSYIFSGWWLVALKPKQALADHFCSVFLARVHYSPGNPNCVSSFYLEVLFWWKLTLTVLCGFSEDTIAYSCPFWMSAYIFSFLKLKKKIIPCFLCFYCSPSVALSLNDMGNPRVLWPLSNLCLLCGFWLCSL